MAFSGTASPDLCITLPVFWPFKITTEYRIPVSKSCPQDRGSLHFSSPPALVRQLDSLNLSRRSRRCWITCSDRAETPPGVKTMLTGLVVFETFLSRRTDLTILVGSVDTSLNRVVLPLLRHSSCRPTLRCQNVLGHCGQSIHRRRVCYRAQSFGSSGRIIRWIITEVTTTPGSSWQEEPAADGPPGPGDMGEIPSEPLSVLFVEPAVPCSGVQVMSGDNNDVEPGPEPGVGWVEQSRAASSRLLCSLWASAHLLWTPIKKELVYSADEPGLFF